MPQLRPYQLEAVKEVLDKKRVLIADDMGLGKCAESIAAKTAIERRAGYSGKALVISPTSVIPHWKDEIRLWYHKGDETKIAQIESSSYDNDVRVARGADFVIMGYSALSQLGDKSSKFDSLRSLDIDYGIIDEAHNAKNPESLRSAAARSLLQSPEYLAVLSGTPIPNTLVDIYSLLNLLDRESFPIVQENARSILTSFYSLFRQDPEFVSRVIGDRRIRRTVEDYLEGQFPRLVEQNLEVLLEGVHREAYMEVYENDDIPPATKLIQLRKAALDPALVNPDFVGDSLRSHLQSADSDTYCAIDGLAERVADHGGKLLIFSDFKKGVTEKLRSRYASYGAVVIDGKVPSSSSNGSISEREEIRQRFQNDPNCKVLIATTVMDEGVDLTAATDVVHATLPYAPAAFRQRNRRAQRLGEVEKEQVTSHTVLPILDNGIATIIEGQVRLLEDKERIIQYIEKEPFSLTKRDLEEIRNGTAQRSNHLVPLIKSPADSIFSHFGQLKGQGHTKILEHYEKYPEEAEYIARLYAAHWEGYYGGNTANLSAQVVSTLMNDQGLEGIIDLASGPFCLSRKIGVPVDNLDINPHMLMAGKRLASEGIVPSGNEAVQGSFHQLPFSNSAFDLAHCSLGLHYASVKAKPNEMNEREQVFREINRVLPEGGHAVITLPHSVLAPQDMPQFNEGLERLGFEVLPYTGIYTGPKDTKFKVYLAGLRKQDAAQEEPIDPSLLSWRMDKRAGKRKSSSKKRRKGVTPQNKIVLSEDVTEFVHADRKKSLIELVRESVK